MPIATGIICEFLGGVALRWRTAGTITPELQGHVIIA